MSVSALSSAHEASSPQRISSSQGSSPQAASSIQVIETPITGGEVVANESEPFAALVQFYRAFNSRDFARVSESWHHGEDVAMDNPLGGIRRGWPAVRAAYARIFRGPARVEVAFHDYTLHRAGDVFYAVGRERGTCATGNGTLNLAIRTTRLFRCFDGVWRQVHHHGSIDDPQLLGAYRRAVRQS